MAKKLKKKRNQSSNQNGNEGSGIVDLVWLDPKDLTDHPDNWNLHPERQISALGASMEANTFFSPILFNLETNRIVGGHGRKKAAIRKKLKSVPVVRGRWTKDQELRILRDDNILARMSEIDPKALGALNDRIDRAKISVQETSQRTKLDLERLQKDTDDLTSQILEGTTPGSFVPSKDTRIRPTDNERNKLEKEDVERNEVIQVNINDDAIFSTKNSYGLPDILTDKLAVSAPEGTFDRTNNLEDELLWYCVSTRPFPKSDERSGGVLGFFTEDYRFQRCYERPSDFYAETIVDNDWTSVCEPDFSTYGDWPYALRLFNLYKARWCCRFWQELDIDIIPLIYKCTEFKQEPELFYESLPKHIPVAATHCRLTHLKSTRHWADFFKSLDLACSLIDFGRIIIYGGPEFETQLRDELPKGPEYVLLSSFMAQRRKTFKE